MVLSYFVFICALQVIPAFRFPDPKDFSTELLSSNVSDKCLAKLRNMSSETRLKYLDASGRPRSGILSGNTRWFGSFGTCLSYANSRYCYASIGLLKTQSLTRIGYGVCIPDECNQKDVLVGIHAITTAAQRFLPSFHLSAEPGNTTVICYEKPAIDAGVKCTIVFFSIILAFCVVGTVIEMVHETFGDSEKAILVSESNGGVKPSNYSKITDNGVLKPTKNETSPLLGTDNPLSYSSGVIGKQTDLSESHQLSQKQETEQKQDNKTKVLPYYKLVEFLLCFSLLRNSRKVMSTDVSADTITCLNGLRVISLFWVILGHIYMISAKTSVMENMSDMLSDGQRFSMMVITNGIFSVDSFLVLSGLLLAYHSFKVLKKNHGHMNWTWFYLHRYLRLTPTLMIVILFVAKIQPFLIRSPSWYRQQGPNECSDNWWTNMLYINNFYPTDIANELCIGPTWYLAIDMQFFVISPIFICLFSRYGYKGAFGTSIFLLLFPIIVISVLVDHYNINVMGELPNFLLTNPKDSIDFFNYVYTKPYCRIQPYIVGFLFGYLIRTKNKFFRVKTLGWPLSLVCWLLSFALGLIVVYAPYNTAKRDPHIWSKAESIIFASVRHLIWGVTVTWVIYACEYGYGGYVKEFLSAKFWIPLSRLNYSAFLLHYPIIYVMFVGYRNGLNYTTELMVYYYCAALVLSYAVAFIVVVTIEYPFVNIEMIFKPKPGKK